MFEDSDPSIIYICSIQVQEGGAYPSCLQEEAGNTWMGLQSIRGPIQGQTTMHTHYHDLFRITSWPNMFLDCGRKLENLRRTLTCRGRTCKLHTDGTSWDQNLEPSVFLLWAKEKGSYMCDCSCNTGERTCFQLFLLYQTAGLSIPEFVWILQRSHQQLHS